MNETTAATVSIAIPTLGRSDRLFETLKDVRALQPAPLEILVVDGDPSPQMEAAVTALGNRPPLHYLPAERGLTKQRNAALERAEGDVVVFFDDDVRVPPDVLAQLLPAYADRAVVGATGFVDESPGSRKISKYSVIKRLLPGGGRDGGFTRFGYPRRLIDLSAEQDVSFMQGCFMSVRTEAGRRIRFDESLPGYGLAEDEDFSYRLSRVGRIRYLPNITVHHLNLGFGGRDQVDFNRQVVVNRAYLFRKNFEGTLLARIQFAMFIGLLFAHRAINGEWKGLKGLLEGTLAVRRERRHAA